MADTCSINFNRKVTVNGTDKIEVSQLWKDLKQEFKKDRRKAVAHYLLSQDGEFQMQNIGTLQLDSGGEITLPSLLKAMEENQNKTMFTAKSALQKSLNDQEFSYMEALENAITFNKNPDYYELEGKDDDGFSYPGLMAMPVKQANGKYALQIVERTYANEALFASHVQNKILTDFLKQTLEQHGLSIDFLEESQTKVKFDSTQEPIADQLMKIATVLQGEESSMEMAEVAGHFIIGSMKDDPLVEKLIRLFKEGNGELSGMQIQQLIFRGGTPDSNPFYREDFDMSPANAVEAAGIVLGVQLIAPIANAEYEQKMNSWANKAVLWLLKQVRRLCMKAGKKYRFVEKRYTSEMINHARELANEVAAGYLDYNASSGESLRASFLANREVDEKGRKGSVYVHKGGISQLDERSKKSVQAYRDTLSELKSMAGELKSLLPRSDERPENRKMFEDLKELIAAAQIHADPNLNMASFAESTTQESIAMILYQLSDMLSGPVDVLLSEISSDSDLDNFERSMKDYASMRSIIAIYKQCASLLDSLYVASKDCFDLNRPVTIKVNGVRTTHTLQEYMNMLMDKLAPKDGDGIDLDSGLPKVIDDKLNSMYVNWAKEFYGNDYIDLGARVLWAREAPARMRKRQGMMGRIGIIRITDMEDRMISLRQYAETLEKDISIADRWLYAAHDSADLFTQAVYKAARKANYIADKQSGDFWYRLQELRQEMNDLFGTEDCSIFFERNLVQDDKGNFLTGNLIQVGLTEEESSKDGILYGAWEAERRAFEEDLILRFRNFLEEQKQAFYKDPDNEGLVYYLTDAEQSVLYHSFIKDEWEKWHAEHSVKDETPRNKGAWIPNPEKYKNPQFEELFVNAPNGEERLKWYRKLLSIKYEMDSMLPSGATVYVRAPQIKGTLRHRKYNLKDGKQKKAFRRAVAREMGDRFHIRPDEAYLFGTNNEFNMIDEDPMEHKIFFEKEKRERLAFWGVNRLPDMSDINTDLFSTMANYGAMACSYQAMSSVVDIAELGERVLASRQLKKPGDNEKIQKKGVETNTYTRYCKLVEKNIYGLNVTPPKYQVGKLAVKILNNLSRLGVRFMLEWAYPGGTVNAGTGLIEILKEAGAGEYFTGKELREAIGFFYKHCIQNWYSEGGNQAKMDELSLLVRHFNMLGNNKEFFKKQQYDKGWIADMFGPLGMGPNWKSWFKSWPMAAYELGEFFMQVVPYVALAKHQKYFIEAEDAFGNKDLIQVSMPELYDFKDVETDEDGNIISSVDRVTLKKDQIVYLSRDDYDDYNMIQEILNKIDELKGSGSHRPMSTVGLSMTEAQKKRLGELGITVRDYDPAKPEKMGWKPADQTYEARYSAIQQLERVLKKQQKKHIFTETTESDFIDLGRQICDRLHGLYATESKNLTQQHWFLNLLSGMRGWIFGVLANRFRGDRYNLVTKQSEEAYMQTDLKVWFDLFQNWETPAYRHAALRGVLMNGAFSGILGTSLAAYFPMVGLPICGLNLMKGLIMTKFMDKSTERIMTGDAVGPNGPVGGGYSKYQYRNIRRSAYTYMWISFLTLLKALLRVKWKDDKPVAATNPVLGVIYYLTARLLREQSAFNTIGDAKNEIISITPIPTGLAGGIDLFRFATMWTQEGIDRLDGEKDVEGKKHLYYQKNEPGYYMYGDSKATVQFLRRTGYGDLYWLWMKAVMQEEPDHVGRTTNVLKNGYKAGNDYLDYTDRKNR